MNIVMIIEIKRKQISRLEQEIRDNIRKMDRSTRKNDQKYQPSR